MRQYRTDGSAAVDVYAARENTARSLSKKPKRLPDVPAREKPAQRPRAAISLTAVVGAAAALFLLFLVVFSYVRLYELKSEVGELKQTVVKLNEQSDALRSEYEAKLDLQQVERRARELGLHEASRCKRSMSRSRPPTPRRSIRPRRSATCSSGFTMRFAMFYRI